MRTIPACRQLQRYFERDHIFTSNFLYRKEGVVRTMSYSESRARYAEVLDSVVNDREEIVITRSGHEPVVVVSLADFESLRDTASLIRSERAASARCDGTT